MKKLRNKVFWVIFAILTIFLLSILFIFNYQDYQKEEKNIQNNLMVMGEERGNRRLEDKPELDIENEQRINIGASKIYMDYTVYTIILNQNNEILDIVNHSPNEVDKEKIEEIAKKILNSDNKENVKIGNLYTEQYSYAFKMNNTLTIIDNSAIKDRLSENLKNSIIIALLLEIIIIYVAVKLTSWIIKPVINAFDKQKQFVQDASHELKTPLAVIIASAEALKNEPNESKWLDNIKSESERMNNLISTLLDMAKSENDTNVLYKTENLSKIVEKSILTFESLMYEKNIKLEYKIEDDINFMCNSDQIKQVIGILVDNAIKHSVDHGEINVNLKKEKSNIILEVQNKGKEIPKEEQEKIFERFYRGDESRNRNENRYGLGLAIAKNIVENHKGTIGVISNNGYTTFKIILK